MKRNLLWKYLILIFSLYKLTVIYLFFFNNKYKNYVNNIFSYDSYRNWLNLTKHCSKEKQYIVHI